VASACHASGGRLRNRIGGLPSDSNFFVFWWECCGCAPLRRDWKCGYRHSSGLVTSFYFYVQRLTRRSQHSQNQDRRRVVAQIKPVVSDVPLLVLSARGRSHKNRPAGAASTMPGSQRRRTNVRVSNRRLFMREDTCFTVTLGTARRDRAPDNRSLKAQPSAATRTPTKVSLRSS